MLKLVPLALVLGLTACGGGDSYAASEDTNVSELTTQVTEEAAAAKAEAEITAENADEEFEKLKSAIESDDGDF